MTERRGLMRCVRRNDRAHGATVSRKARQRDLGRTMLMGTSSNDRAGRMQRFRLAAAYAYVFEAQGAEAGGIQKILCVDDDRVLQQRLNFIEI
jgi:hypothetical protein